MAGKTIASLLLGLAWLLAGVGPACSQVASDADKYPVLSTRCEPTSITVGDQVKFTVTAVSPELQRFILRDPFSDKDQTTWTLVGSAVVTDQKISSKEWRRSTEFTLTTFELGEVEIPPVEVSYQPPGGGEPITRNVSGVLVNVNSVLGDDEDQAALADIKEPLPVPLPAWVNWVLGSLAALVVGMIAFLVWRSMRGKIGELMNPSLKPDEWALLQIEECEREKLIEQKKLKELYTRLSDTLRQYLGKTFDFKAMDMTTGELLTHLEDIEGYEPITHRQDFSTARQRLSELLDEADLVKFARFLPEASRSRHALEKAREVVRLSRYKLQPAPTEQQSPGGNVPPPAQPQSPPQGPSMPRREEAFR